MTRAASDDPFHDETVSPCRKEEEEQKCREGGRQRNVDAAEAHGELENQTEEVKKGDKREDGRADEYENFRVFHLLTFSRGGCIMLERNRPAAPPMAHLVKSASTAEPAAERRLKAERVKIRNDEAANRFVTEAEGGEATIGYTTNAEGHLDLHHTWVPREARGQGVAEALARYAFDWARREQRRIIPSCPFIRKWVEAHPEEHDIVAYGS